jgi:hypothetical protein
MNFMYIFFALEFILHHTIIIMTKIWHHNKVKGPTTEEKRLAASKATGAMT